MEKIIKGSEVLNSGEFSGSTDFCDFSGVVKKGHDICGDSAFAYTDENKTIIAVFDGVSGEPGADVASAEAAEFFLDYLKKVNKISQKKMEAAAHIAKNHVKSGFTTASIIFLEKNGVFIAASVGDSPIYGVDKNRNVDLELPISRPVGDGDSILKFFNFRVFVSTVFGGFQSNKNPEIHMNMRKGRLGKDELLIVASDCLVDNLYMDSNNGYITDSTGKSDLKSLIGLFCEPKKIIEILSNEIEKRSKGKKVELGSKILEPKLDDLAIIVLRRL
ncbi:MAG: protein phosphatase 2C domain-containing protein [Candidatus Micrarchaeota archaeon]